MKKLLLAIIAGFAIGSVTTITSDGGGNVVSYAWYYKNLRDRGETVVIDGYCASSCTMALGLPDVCVTQKAVLAFHAAYTPILFWHIRNQPATDYLWSTYPKPIQGWITAHGGLQPNLIFLQGEELRSLVKQC